MARPSPYTDAQKTAILEAVKSGRKAGTKWPEVLTAATEAGFKGGLQYLMKMASKAGAVRRKRKSGRAAKTVAAVKVKGKRGRPKGSKNATRGPGRPRGSAGAGNGAGLGDIDRIVARMVEQRVGAKVSVAILALERAAGALRAL